MSEALPWFRVYHEIIDDDKVRLLAFEDRWHFVAVLCCKAKGILDEEQTFDMLQRRMAVRLGLQVREMEELKRRLMEVGLIDEDWQPSAWHERQRSSDSDKTAAERMRRHRQKKASGQDQGTTEGVTEPLRVTDRNRYGDVTRLEESRGDKSRYSARAKTAHQMPDDFELTESRRSKSLKHAPHLSPEEEWGHFVDHHLARGTTFKDWDRAWGTWVRRAAKYNPAPAQPAVKRRRKL